MSISKKFFLPKILPLLAVTIITASFFYFQLYRYLSFESLHTHRKLLLQWRDENYLLSVGTYIGLYITVSAASLPCNVFFCIAGGFLFGFFPGLFYILFSATLGSTLSFLAIKLALADWVEKIAAKWLIHLEQGFKKNAFHFIVSLRLIPIFPFFVVNAIAGLLGINLITFITATFIGIIPAVLIYTSVGHSLESLFNAEKAPDYTILLQPYFLFPLLGLALLASLPILYKGLKKYNIKLSRKDSQ
jgi:uncharacterized membrane protein YdjX (TVP38/TMEM64 family)